MSEDGFEIFAEQTEVVEPDQSRRIGAAFVLMLVTAVGVGVLAIWAFATAINWFIVHIVNHLPQLPGFAG